MKKIILFAWFALVAVSAFSQKPNTPASQMEKLDRGVVVVPTSIIRNFVSWRLLGTDDKSATTFDVLRNRSTLGRASLIPPQIVDISLKKYQ